MRPPQVLGLSVLLHVYLGLRLVSPLPWPPGQILLSLLLSVSALLVPVGMFSRRLAKPPLADRLAWAGLPFLGLFSSLFVLTLARDAALLLAWLASLPDPAAVPLEQLRYLTAGAVPPAAILITLVGFLNARRTAQVVTVDIPLPGLPGPLHGFTIVQISDIHVGPTIRHRYVEGIVEAVNLLRPDVVAITGDLVDGSVAELGAQVAPLRRLVARSGIYFVTGNHEYYSGVQPWLDELRRLGVRVLLNEHVVIERDGARLVLAGVADYMAAHFEPAHRSDPRAALAGAPGNATKVLLAHQPRSAAAASEAGFDLQVSGHTHGGQFLPWKYFVQFQQPFTAGLHKVGQMWIYVSRGTGYWGPPKRFGAPSEITQLRLVASAG